MRGESPPPPRYLALAPELKGSSPPRTPGAPLWTSPDSSKHEELFFHEIAPRLLPADTLRWLHCQVAISTLAQVPVAGLARVDFALLHPALKGKALIIEIDGAQHSRSSQRAIDEERDDMLAAAGHRVFRLTPGDLEDGPSPTLAALTRGVTEIVDSPVGDSQTLAAVQTMACMVELVEHGILSPGAESWAIAVRGTHTRAMGAGILAAQQLLTAVGDLYGATLAPASIDLLGEAEEQLADVVIEWRDDTPWFTRPANSDAQTVPVVGLRPTWLPILPPLPLPPPTWVAPRHEVSSSSLRSLLQSIFPDKESFWDGQEVSLRRCLEGRDTLVLLPTGAGKSLIYQLASILLPGLTLVVAPLVALMNDQLDNLFRAGISRVTAISSQTTQAGDTTKIQDLLRGGVYLMCYVSPERLQIVSFRDSLRTVASEMPIPLVVIDEAHCVSEWGHDFRPAYLSVARTARRIGRRDNDTPPALVGLTGTASRSVLHDLMHELDISELEAVITPKDFDRPELTFAVHHCRSDAKARVLEGVVRSIPTHIGIRDAAQFADLGPKRACGIIFCPHVRGQFGVVAVARALGNTLGFRVPYYSGSDPAAVRSRIASDFKDNEFPLLVATKAFGMGIDKPNIRYTVHYSLTESLEAFYQEAGRAGRTKQRSHCAMIASVDDHDRVDQYLAPSTPIEELHQLAEDSLRAAHDDVDRALWFHLQGFRGIPSDLEDLKGVLDQLAPLSSRGERIIPFGEEDEPTALRRRERAIHRLLILKAVDDYTVDYSKHRITVQLGRLTRGSSWASAYEYVSMYSRGRADALFGSRASPSFSDLKTELVETARVLLGFVYETIELGRRAAIREVWRWSRGKGGDRTLRRRLLDYLQETVFSREVERILRESENDIARWRALQGSVASKRDVEELDGALSRAFADYPDHPAILAMRSVLFLRQRQCKDALEFAIACVRSLHTSFRTNAQTTRDYMTWLVAEAARWELGTIDVLVLEATRSADLQLCRELAKLDLPIAARLGLLPRLATLASQSTARVSAMLEVMPNG
ncbi:MAG: hypothetical protein A2133_07250 [Actinobacteria bacterium RBG_16_64_13]|nr:MAG: hypothetical protein A2133_07250 [Actinobacteria bacterium RBG_16_64_13]